MAAIGPAGALPSSIGGVPVPIEDDERPRTGGCGDSADLAHRRVVRLVRAGI